MTAVEKLKLILAHVYRVNDTEHCYLCLPYRQLLAEAIAELESK